MISNPVAPFINGSDRAEYTYEPGPDPYHFCFVEHGLLAHYELNCMVFARDEYHAKEIYIGMVEHLIQGMRAYVNHKIEVRQVHPETLHRTNDKIPRLESVLKKLKDVPTWMFEEYYPDHPIKVGWASNDTFA